MARIAWVGLGNMGLPMAKHLVRAGHSVAGVEVSAVAAKAASEAGMTVFDDIRVAVAEAEVVFTMLPTADHVSRVLSGPTGHLRYGST